MENQLTLVKRDHFNGLECDFYKQGKEVWMTREQIGSALEYKNPRKAIGKIHERNKSRMDKFSTVVKLTRVENGREVEREIFLYSAKGVYEICRWSKQKKANEFFDFVYDVLEALRTGNVRVNILGRIDNLLTRRSDKRITLDTALMLPEDCDKRYLEDLTNFDREQMEGFLRIAVGDVKRLKSLAYWINKGRDKEQVEQAKLQVKNALASLHEHIGIVYQFFGLR